MIDPTEKMVFPARTRQGRGKLRVTKRAAEGEDAAQGPEGHDGRARGDFPDLEAEAGEDSRANHVGYD